MVVAFNHAVRAIRCGEQEHECCGHNEAYVGGRNQPKIAVDFFLFCIT